MSRGLKICGAEADAYFTPTIECEQKDKQNAGTSARSAGNEKAKVSK